MWSSGLPVKATDTQSMSLRKWMLTIYLYADLNSHDVAQTYVSIAA